MKLVLLAGPQAVGKMTVGQELANITDLKLFHNHQTIEIIRDLVPLDEEGWKLVDQLREAIFRAFAKSGQYGMIFTLLCVFPKDAAYWERIKNCFREARPESGFEFYFVELEAEFDERLRRNKTENRLLHKPSKRDIEWSEGLLHSYEEQYRMNSLPGEVTEPNYLRINNTCLTAEEAAKQIKETFDL